MLFDERLFLKCLTLIGLSSVDLAQLLRQFPADNARTIIESSTNLPNQVCFLSMYSVRCPHGRFVVQIVAAGLGTARLLLSGAAPQILPACLETLKSGLIENLRELTGWSNM